MSNAYVKWKADMLVANRILCEGGNVLKQLSEQALKVCCSGHMLQCLISRSGETYGCQKKMMNTFTLGNITMKNDFQRKRTEELGLHGEHIWEAFRPRRVTGLCFQMKDI